jgi:fused signal recognition particle receptor
MSIFSKIKAKFSSSNKKDKENLNEPKEDASNIELQEEGIIQEREEENLPEQDSEESFESLEKEYDKPESEIEVNTEEGYTEVANEEEAYQEQDSKDELNISSEEEKYLDEEEVLTEAEETPKEVKDTTPEKVADEEEEEEEYKIPEEGLKKTSEKLSSGIFSIFGKRKLTDEALEELEEILIMSDIGPKTSAKIVSQFSKQKFSKDITDEEIKNNLSAEIQKILETAEADINAIEYPENRPLLLKFVGVNGTGKTTTIGKLAAQHIKSGQKVMIVACDTFRAAAVEQLKKWAERSGAEFFSGNEGADPASVAFSAYEKALKDGIDVIMVDTAGRLHNKKQLMDELSKISRVLKKKDESLPDETILVLDSTTGQNAISQVENFMEIDNVSGLIVTKLDGSAKGGVVISIADSFNLPIFALGFGESISDLKEFKASEFAKALIA